jgi:fructoselysine-6-P-deglycase FrlB-like protein
MLETAHIQSFSYTAGQFIHGPVEVIDPSFGCILFDFDPAVREETDRVLGLTEQFGGKALVMTNRTDLSDTAQRMVLRMDCANPFLAPLLEIIPIELWVLYAGEKMSYTPGVLHRVHK